MNWSHSDKTVPNPEAGESKRDKEGTIAALIAEVVFAMLPLLLIVMIFTHTDRHSVLDVFASPEWSFGSSVLFGQTLAKLVSGLSKSGRTRPGAATLVTSLLIVFGLAPALIINAITLQAPEGHAVGITLPVIQVLDFLAAAFVYVIIGSVAERHE